MSFKFRLPFSIAIALLVSCSPAEEHFNALHLKSTPDCSQWIDASWYPIDGSDTSGTVVGVSWGSISRLQHGQIIISILLPAGRELRLTNKSYTIRAPGSGLALRAKAQLWANAMDKEAAQKLEAVPDPLRAPPSPARTLYSLVLTVEESLPQRFDVVLPDFALDGRTYPVRVFSYNYFPDRNARGLCQ